MPRLVEGLSRFFGRVEILARGLENERRAAELALAQGRPLDARDRARTILAEVPESAVGLALWADAAEDAGIDHEVVTALAELSRRVPWRADVWLRLGRAGLRTGWPDARAALERAASAPEEREAARMALLDLSDSDLAAGDPARALRWLDRIPAALGGADAEVALRRAECALARGDVDVAETAVSAIGADAPTDARRALLRARLELARGSVASAVDAAVRAFILEAPGADQVLAAVVAGCRDVVLVDRVRRVVASTGQMQAPRWEAAFAFAEGRRSDARRALARGLAEGDAAAATTLLGLATETRDIGALRVLAARDPNLLPADLRTLLDACALVGERDDTRALDRLDAVGGEASAWAQEIRSSILRSWLPAPIPDAAGAEAPPAADWTRLLEELRRLAKGLDRLDVVAAIEALAVERERPLRAAVVGEFNAGKSTFLNALLGVDVAPTGVLPTTATLHWVAWALDPFARIVVRQAQDRVVPHAELKSALRALVAEGAHVERVFIYAPIERLKRVEILDTPGFNAPDPEHLAAARQAFDEAHVAIWLFDATGPMKETERRVLSEVRDLGVPVQILVNKADRLPAEEMPAILEHVREGLASSGLVSHAPPVAFSARLSLKGRLGDAAALEASGWTEVEALFAQEIVDRSDALRERALRRKAGAIAGRLARVAAERAERDQAALREARARNDALRQAGAKLRRERPALAKDVDRHLEDARRALAQDLRPLAELPEERRREEGVVAYVQERIVARLAEPVAREIARIAGTPSTPRAAAAVRAVLLGASATLDRPESAATRSFDEVAAAAIEAFAAALVADAEVALPPDPSAALAARAEALAHAFAPAVDAALTAPIVSE